MSREDPPMNACPDDELLASFIERRLDEERRETIERHVATCVPCTDIVAASLAAADDTPAAPAAFSAATAAIERPQRHRRTRRLALAASLVLAATAALGYAGGRLLLAAAAREIARHASTAAGAPVTIGSVGVGVSPGLSLLLRLDDVHIAGVAPIAAARVEIAMALAALVRGALAVEAVQLTRPLLHLGGPAPAAPESPGAPRSFDLGGGTEIFTLLAQRSLEIRDGSLVIAVAGAEPLTVTHVNGTLQPRGDTLVIAFAGALAGGSVTATGTLAPEAKGGLAVTIGGTDLALGALPYAGGRASGLTELRLDVRGAATAPTVSGRLRLHGVRIAGWNPLPALLDPPSAPGLVAVVFPELAAPDLALDDLRVSFAAHRGARRIGRATFASAAIRGTGSLRLHRDGALSGAGRLSVSAALARALLAHAPTLGFPAADGSLTLPFHVDGSLTAPRLTLAH